MRTLPLLFIVAACTNGGADTVDPPDDQLPAEVCHDATTPPTEAAFTLVTDAWGLTDVRGTRMSTADFDDDGRPDLLVNRGDAMVRNDLGGGVQYTHLLRNTGAGFEDVTAASGITEARNAGDASRAFQLGIWGDVDNDGDLDLFTGVFLDRNVASTYGETHELLLNDGAGGFELAPDSELRFESTLSGAAFVDVDQDGHLDLWLTGWYERYGAIYGEQDTLLLGQGGLSRFADDRYNEDYADWSVGLFGAVRSFDVFLRYSDTVGLPGRDDAVVVVGIERSLTFPKVSDRTPSARSAIVSLSTNPCWPAFAADVAGGGGRIAAAPRFRSSSRRCMSSRSSHRRHRFQTSPACR